jgi:hypothetical protein
MQSNPPVKRLPTRSEPGAGAAARDATQVARAGVPTLLDLAANPALEGIAQRTLLDVCMDLFAKLEASLVTNRQEFIAAYFATLKTTSRSKPSCSTSPSPPSRRRRLSWPKSSTRAWLPRGWRSRKRQGVPDPTPVGERTLRVDPEGRGRQDKEAGRGQ